MNLRESNSEMKMSSAYERSVTPQRDEVKPRLSSLLLGVSSRSMVSVVNALSVVVNKMLTSCWLLKILIPGKHCMFPVKPFCYKVFVLKFCVIDFFLIIQPHVPNTEGLTG